MDPKIYRSRPIWPWASYQTFLVGCWTNPFKKYDCQIGSFPQVGLKQSPSFFGLVNFLDKDFFYTQP